MRVTEDEKLLKMEKSVEERIKACQNATLLLIKNRIEQTMSDEGPAL